MYRSKSKRPNLKYRSSCWCKQITIQSKCIVINEDPYIQLGERNVWIRYGCGYIKNMNQWGETGKPEEMIRKSWFMRFLSLTEVWGDEFLTLRALKISMFHKRFIFQCMGKIFCVEFQRYPLKFHTKYLTNTLKDMTFIQHWNLKSS